MIGLFRVKISDKKGNKIAELEVVGKSAEAFQTDSFYQKRAMKNAGFDIATEKWSIEKFKFEAELIKDLNY